MLQIEEFNKINKSIYWESIDYVEFTLKNISLSLFVNVLCSLHIIKVYYEFKYTYICMLFY